MILVFLYFLFQKHILFFKTIIFICNLIDLQLFEAKLSL